MKNQSPNWLLYLSAIPILAVAVFFSQVVKQPDFFQMMGCFALFFLLYALIWHSVKTEKEIWFFIGVALLTRVLLIFALPNLSDDFYRYIWDGRLTNLGINPYRFLPTDLIQETVISTIESDSSGVFSELNSQGYYSVYPPVNQLVFAVSTWFFPINASAAVILMKLIFLCAEAGTIWLIIRLCSHFRLPQKTVLLYALNPLIILETFNNLHFEILMICFLALSLWCLVKGFWWWSAIAMAFAVGTKLLPLMFLPFLVKTLGWSKSIRYFLVTGLIVLLLFSPVLNGFFIKNFMASIDLYFRKFEFNASIYYLLRWIGYRFTGHNIIQDLGPLLGLITTGFIIWRAIIIPSGKPGQLPLNWMLAMTAFLLFSTTVHPWYLSSLIFLCLFTNYRYPVVWSGLILFTYINYSYLEYTENYWVVTLEYALLASFMWYEYRRGFRYRNEQIEH